MGTAGRPLDAAEIRTFDENDRELPPNVVETIVTRPKIAFSSFSEYYNEPGKTLESLGNVRYHTGDLGYSTRRGASTSMEGRRMR